MLYSSIKVLAAGLILSVLFNTALAAMPMGNQSYVYVDDVEIPLAVPSYLMIRYMLTSGQTVSVELASELVKVRWQALMRQNRRNTTRADDPLLALIDRTASTQ